MIFFFKIYLSIAGMEAGSRIGSIQANDIDSHPHLVYAFIQPSNPGFSIDKFSGVLSLRTPLDRETQDRYRTIQSFNYSLTH